MKVHVLLGFVVLAAAVTAQSATGFTHAHDKKAVQIDHIEPARFGPGFELCIAGRGFQSTDVVKIGRLELEKAVITDREIRGVVPIRAKGHLGVRITSRLGTRSNAEIAYELTVSIDFDAVYIEP